VSESNWGRMLLSHNFQVSPEFFTALSRSEFTTVFAEGLGSQMKCQMLDNPHWVVEILFPADVFTPQQVGELCAQALAAKRQPATHHSVTGKLEILVLGGLKTTPPTSDSPAALQPGNWGVDVVETSSGEEFLRSINWDTMIADKPPATIFQVAASVG
jgi:Protein of unknown function (DUF2656)